MLKDAAGIRRVVIACYRVSSIPGVTASLKAVSWSVTYPQEDPDKISAP